MAKEIWRSHVVVDDPNFHVFNSSASNLAGLRDMKDVHSAAKSRISDIDKFKGVLRDPPKKKGIKFPYGNAKCVMSFFLSLSVLFSLCLTVAA